MTISLLSQLLQSATLNFHVYDVGRRVQHIPAEVFTYRVKQAPYPMPFKGHAWIGIVFWHTQDTPFVWFFKLPLDANSYVDSKALQHIIGHIQQVAGENLTQTLSRQQQEQLNHMPFIFKPSPVKQAVFHAKVTHALAQHPSQHLEAVQAYLATGQGDWQTLGLQGIADYCARHSDLAAQAHLAHMLPNYTGAAQICHCRHFNIDDTLAVYSHTEKYNRASQVRHLPHWQAI